MALLNSSIKNSILAATIFFSGYVLASDDALRFISVTGQGEISAEPDIAWISSGVNTQAETAGEALNNNSEVMAQLINVLLDADIEKKHIQTSALSVSPVYDYSNNSNENRLVGYQVNNTVTVKVVDLESIGELLDQLVKSGSNQISQIRFGFEDDEALLNQARVKAIENALAKATLYSNAADAEVGSVISISEAGTNFPQPVYRQSRHMESFSSSASSAAPVMSGEQNISASITIVYELDD